jgi:hypothetical protein
MSLPYRSNRPMSQPSNNQDSVLRSQLADLAAGVRALQEAHMQSSYDADQLGKQLTHVQQQVLALSRRLTTIEARLIQRMQSLPSAEPASDADEAGEDSARERGA